MKEKYLFNKPVVLINGENSLFFRNCFVTYNEGFNPLKVLEACTGKIKTHRGELFRFATEDEINFIKSGDTPGVCEEVIYFAL